jgi:hypothetical protein
VPGDTSDPENLNGGRGVVRFSYVRFTLWLIVGLALLGALVLLIILALDALNVVGHTSSLGAAVVTGLVVLFLGIGVGPLLRRLLGRSRRWRVQPTGDARAQVGGRLRRRKPRSPDDSQPEEYIPEFDFTKQPASEPEQKPAPPPEPPPVNPG